MLENALKYKEKIKLLMDDVWYDTKYMFYFCGTGRFEEDMTSGEYGNRRYFASVKKTKKGKKKIIGLISYTADEEVSRAIRFGAINFTDDIYTMGRDIAQVIDDIFCKFNMHSLEWWCVTDNPIEKSYDKLIDKYGGRIVGVLNDTTKTIDGTIHGSKIYEIMRDDYFAAKQRMKLSK